MQYHKFLHIESIDKNPHTHVLVYVGGCTNRFREREEKTETSFARFSIRPTMKLDFSPVSSSIFWILNMKRTEEQSENPLWIWFDYEMRAALPYLYRKYYRAIILYMKKILSKLKKKTIIIADYLIIKNKNLLYLFIYFMCFC